MLEISLTGWQAELNKVALTKALQSVGGLSLASAKGATDQLLENPPARIFVSDDVAIDRILSTLQALGVTALVQTRPSARQVG